MNIAALLTSFKHGSITQAEAVAEIESLIELERMQLRDEFAGRAMQGMAADAKKGPDTIYMNYPVVAREAYTIADAMLEARKA